MLKILLVEDNEVDAFIMQKVIMLSGADIRLEIAEDAAQALTLLTNQFLESRELPDLILVDQFMPRVDGLQFMDAFAALEMPGKDKVVTLMLTSSIDPHLTAEAMRHGAHGLIPKPISIPMIAELITRALPSDPMVSKDPIS